MAAHLSPTALAEELTLNPELKLLDVREEDEFAYTRLPNARLLPLSELSVRFHELADWKNSKVVVYCHHGIRSLHAIQFLEMQGFNQLINLSGGIDAWSIEVDPHIRRY